MTDRRRLSTIDKLPDEAVPHVQWAWDRVKEERTDQNAILAQFNERLAQIGCKPISSSSFNRFALNVRFGRTRPKDASREPHTAPAGSGELADELMNLRDAVDRVSRLLSAEIDKAV